MNRLGLMLTLLVLASTPLSLAQEEATGDVAIGATTELPTPPIRLPFETGPVSQSPQYLPDGRIGIRGPTTITRSGSYVLLRDLGCPAQGGGGTPAISIESSYVDLDLNGFSVCAGEPAIYAENVGRINIFNGAITAYEEALALVDVDWFTIRDVRISGFEDLCTVALSGSGGLFERNSALGEFAVLCVSGTRMTIRDNQIGPSDPQTTVDILVNNCSGCRVLHNQASTIVANTIGGTIANNVVSHSLIVSGSDSLVLENVVAHGAGAQVTGDRNQIEANLFNSNADFGLRFTGNDCVLRKNMARGNGGSACAGSVSAGDFCDEGLNNTSQGDNYMPSQI